jgi:release factor H-coupled RctB family protein
MTEASIRIITSDIGRMDPLALDQLAQTARLKGSARLVGLPDLHAGRARSIKGKMPLVALMGTRR